ncbi:MAG: type ISP restriction/modification enzyme, partial [Coriobacteriia bacterium]|nr:type ISP restriction/modification enzyme [Coriobacteriia bacterium]
HDRLVERIRVYLDPVVGDAEIAARWPSVMRAGNRFDALATRRALVAKGFVPEQVIPYAYRPFDVRWLYWEPETKLLDEKRAQYVRNVDGQTLWLEARQSEPKAAFNRGYVTRYVGDNMGNGLSSYFPASIGLDEATLCPQSGVRANLSSKARGYLGETEGEPQAPFMHSVAVLNAPTFRQENTDALVADWPRIPLPSSAGLLIESAVLGERVSSLLDPSTGFQGGIGMGALSAVHSVPLDPATDLAVTARWGIAGKGGITMPSTGTLSERAYTDEERVAIAEHAESLGMSAETAIALLGETCFDIYLNDVAYWSCVSANVWRYTIGGYQVIKKWLSYRERALLGRDLKSEEARYVTEMVRRIAALVLLQPELDANYERVKADVWEWASSPSKSG